MIVKLRLVSGSQAGTTWVVVGSPFLIGRHADCGLRIQNPKVSLHHCSIVVRGSEVCVRDLGSTNGTYVNGTRVDAEHPLGIGDQQQTGPAVFELILEPAGVIRRDDREAYGSTQIIDPANMQNQPRTDSMRRPPPRR